MLPLASEHRPVADTNAGSGKRGAVMSGTFGARLRFAMQGETAYSLAKRTGISESLIGRYIKNEVAPRSDRVFKLAEALHVRPEWLLRGETPMLAAGAAVRSPVDAIIERIRDVIGEDAPATFARRAGIDEKFLRQVMARQSQPESDFFFKVARAGNVRPEWLATGTGTRDADKMTPEEAVTLQSAINRAITSAHPGLVAVTHLPSRATFSVPAFMLASVPSGTSNLGLFQVDTDAMAPAIGPNDQILVDMDVQAGDGVFLLATGGAYLVRRLQTMPDGSRFVLADNPAYKPGELSGQTMVVGKGVAVLKPL